jgi:PmbA protein
MNRLTELAERVMESARETGATDAVAEAIESHTRQVRFSNGQIDAVNSWSEKHVALFVAVGKHIISSDLRSFDSAESLARNLVEMARRTPPSKSYGGIASGKFKYRTARPDKKLIQLKNPAKIALDSIDAAERVGANNVGGTFYVRHEKVGLASSGGARGADERASADLSVRAFSQPEASGHAVCCSSRLSSMDAEKTGERAGELSIKARNPVQGTQGKVDLILEPLCLGSFVQSTSDMMSALRVEIDTSMFAKKVGKKVASEEIALIDDPTIDSTTTRLFDHEGVPTRRNVMIKKGVLKTYFHNTSTAKRFKTKTTASAGPLIPTSFSFAAQPIPLHPILEPGEWATNEIIADTAHGLYLNNTWYTRYQNYATGEFSSIPRDAILSVEHGEIVGAIKNIRVSDNMLNFWQSIDALSKTQEEVYWWDEAAPPSHLSVVRARAMNITRSS